MKTLSIADLLPSIKKKITIQEYSGKKLIEGVKIVKLNIFSGEDGTFEEILRLDHSGNLLLFPEFSLQQINRSYVLPGAVKAWHIHYNQEDIWYVPPTDHILLGLWDIRKDSPTKNLTMRIPLGAPSPQLVYIPRGVAHGAANISKVPATIFYYVNQQFSPKHPDENRIPWDVLGKNFWEAKKG